MVATRQPTDSLAKAGGLLLIGRQAGAGAFLLAVLTLPRMTGRATVDAFVWAYFTTLFVSSILNLGLERATAIVVGADHAQQTGRHSIGSLLRVRLATLPVTFVAVVAVCWVAEAHLSAPTLLWTTAWTAAVQVQGVAFAAHRALRQHRHEPVAALVGKLVQAAMLLALARAGAGVTAMVAVMASVELVIAVVACRAVSRRPDEEARSWTDTIGWRELRLFTAIELVAFAYLRVDALLVARLMDSSSGATYNLIYRLVDAATGLATPFLLVLFPAAAGMFAMGRGLANVRHRAAHTAPAAGAVVALAVLVASVPLFHVVPELAEAAPALHVLLAAIPLYFFSAFELHLRSIEGHNPAIIALGAAVLALNVALNLVLVPAFGLTGAALALVACEAAQAAWLLWTGRRATVALAGVAVFLVVAVTLLGAVGWLIQHGAPGPTVVVGLATAALALHWHRSSAGEAVPA